MGHSASFVTLFVVSIACCVAASGAASSPQGQGKGGKKKVAEAPAPPRPPAVSRTDGWQWKVLPAVRAAQTEAAAEAALLDESGAKAEVAPVDAVGGDLFVEVERFVRRSWWKAARTAVARSHKEKLDLTTPVRRAVAQTKHHADELLRWLDRGYAEPAATPMALRWAQNKSAVMLVARFAAKWEAPGASLAVFSTEKGQGHVDQERTAVNVRSLLSVNITRGRIEAEITAKAANSRKRYTLSLDLLDEIVPSGSGWSIHFRKAQGSMQMSKGAEIPELHFQVRKRWPYPRRWPSLTVDSSVSSDAAAHWWQEAPGLTKEEVELLRSSPPRGATTLTCLGAGSIYCSSADECVASCTQCEGLAALHSDGSRCVGALQLAPRGDSTADVWGAEFVDEDLSPAHVGGTFRWRTRDELLAAEAFALCWGFASRGAVAPEGAAASEGWGSLEPLAASEPLGWKLQLAGAEPAALQIPIGTPVVPGASHLLLVAFAAAPDVSSGEVSGLCSDPRGAVAAAAEMLDSWRPVPPVGRLDFEDTDPRGVRLAGTATVRLSKLNEGALAASSYELRWGRLGSGGPEVLDPREPPLAEVPAPASAEGIVHLALGTRSDASVRVPQGAKLLMAFALGPGGVASEEAVTLEFVDVRPPTAAPHNFEVSKDQDERLGFATFSLSFKGATCDPQVWAGDSTSARCDAGSSFVFYWADHEHAKLQPPIQELPRSEDDLYSSHPSGLVVPSAASGIL
ncbi:unnamed protein product, partial [Polarella glacialis]